VTATTATTTRARTRPAALRAAHRPRRSSSPSSPRKSAAAAGANLVLLAIAAAFAVPLYWLISAALYPAATLSVTSPAHSSLANFRAVMNGPTTFRPMLNGLVIAGISAALVMVCAVLAAYPLSRYKLRYGNSFLYVILFGSSLPITAIMVPVYALFVSLNLVDSYVGVILFMSATGLPYAIWMTKNFMDAVPIELEEAAWTDGASSLSALRRIVLPLMLPGLVTILVFNFIEFWGNFFVPYILLLDPAKQPMSVTLYSFFGQHGQVVYGQLAAFAILYTVPVLVLYVLVQRYLQQGFRLSGAVK